MLGLKVIHVTNKGYWMDLLIIIVCNRPNAELI